MRITPAIVSATIGALVFLGLPGVAHADTELAGERPTVDPSVMAVSFLGETQTHLGPGIVVDAYKKAKVIVVVQALAQPLTNLKGGYPRLDPEVPTTFRCEADTVPAYGQTKCMTEFRPRTMVTRYAISMSATAGDKAYEQNVNTTVQVQNNTQTGVTVYAAEKFVDVVYSLPTDENGKVRDATWSITCEYLMPRQSTHESKITTKNGRLQGKHKGYTLKGNELKYRIQAGEFTVNPDADGKVVPLEKFLHPYLARADFYTYDLDWGVWYHSQVNTTNHPKSPIPTPSPEQ